MIVLDFYNGLQFVSFQEQEGKKIAHAVALAAQPARAGIKS